MQVGELYAGKYLPVEDVKTGEVYTVREVTIVMFGRGSDRRPKAVVFFEGQDKGLPMSADNADRMSRAGHPDTENWVGLGTVWHREYVVTSDGPVLSLKLKSVHHTRGKGPALDKAETERTAGIDAVMAADTVTRKRKDK